jgi:hypothetical protein
MLAEIESCEMPLLACHEEKDREAVENEIADLKMAMDLMSIT